MIRSLTQESAWVGTHENIFVLGPTGVGKSFVACALAQKACRDGYSAFYTRAQTVFRDLVHPTQAHLDTAMTKYDQIVSGAKAQHGFRRLFADPQRTRTN